MTLEVQAVSKAFGGIRALKEVTFTIDSPKIFSIIGPNGAGKTTLLNIISGVDRPTAGRILIAGRDTTRMASHDMTTVGVARTFQNLQVFGGMSALENILVGRDRFCCKRLVPILLRSPAMRRLESQSEVRARELLVLVGIGDLADRVANTLPYGSLKRLEVARALAAEPRILLLDEPAAGCNPTEKNELAALIEKIAATGVMVVLVEHDMKLVMRVSHEVLVLNFGGVLAQGSTSQVCSDPQVVSAYLGESLQ